MNKQMQRNNIADRNNNENKLPAVHSDILFIFKPPACVTENNKYFCGGAACIRNILFEDKNRSLIWLLYDSTTTTVSKVIYLDRGWCKDFKGSQTL